VSAPPTLPTQKEESGAKSSAGVASMAISMRELQVKIHPYINSSTNRTVNNCHHLWAGYFSFYKSLKAVSSDPDNSIDNGEF
jgi:hypothetical protein